MKYGLSEDQLKEIQDIISSFDEIEEAILFGSRAIDTYKEASDVDIAIKGKRVTASLAAKLKYRFEEDTYLPFFFDFVAYPTITNEALKKHIETKGVSIYRTGWKECKLGKTGKVITGKTPSKDDPEDWGNDVLFITPSDYKYFGKKAYTSIRMLSTIGAERQKNRLLPPFSVLVTCIGSDMGKSVVNAEACITNQQINAIIPNNFVVSEDYLYYLTIDLYETLRSLGGDGTAVPILNKSDFENIDILLPPLLEQKAIASVLSSLDDKIDLLHRQNKTLEAMAETLFRQWFVEEAQVDWEDGKFPDEFDYVMGASPPGESYNEIGTGIPMFQGNADFEFRFPKKRIFTTNPKRFAEKCDTLVSVRAPVGAQNMANEKCCIGRGVAAFRYKRNTDYFTYTYFKIKSLMKEIKQFNDTGTVFGSISKGNFEAFDVVLPPHELVDKFQKEVKPIDDKVISNTNQIRNLVKLRDTLLPKLMSGEIRVEMTQTKAL